MPSVPHNGSAMLDSCGSMIPRTLKRWREGRFGEEEDWREIPDQIELAPGVVIEIPRPRIVLPMDLQAQECGRDTR